MTANSPMEGMGGLALTLETLIPDLKTRRAYLRQQKKDKERDGKLARFKIEEVTLEAINVVLFETQQDVLWFESFIKVVKPWLGIMTGEILGKNLTYYLNEHSKLSGQGELHIIDHWFTRKFRLFKPEFFVDIRRLNSILFGCIQDGKLYSFKDIIEREMEECYYWKEARSEELFIDAIDEDDNLKVNPTKLGNYLRQAYYEFLRGDFIDFILPILRKCSRCGQYFDNRSGTQFCSKRCKNQQAN